MSNARTTVLVAALAIAFAFVAAPALAAHPEGTPQSNDPADGPVGHDHAQHDEPGGHLAASSKDVALVGKLELTSRAGGIADVGAFGDHAYLNAFSSECLERGGGGTGVHVVDISDPAAPEKVGFLAAEDNSYVGEGISIVRFGAATLLVHNNETCNANLPVVSGFSVWNVTDPLHPVKLGQYGDSTPAVANQTFHTTHSVQAFTWRDKVYAVAQDNQDLEDVDIFDITPTLSGGAAVLVAEVGLEDWPGAQGSYANGDSVFHHDMQQQVIGGHNMLAVSYWDAGQVLLNIDDPANPVFVTDSDFTNPDPLFPSFTTAEGNSHQSYFSRDGRYLLSTDEDFSPTRTLFEITSGTHAGQYGAGEFGWTVPLRTAYPDGFSSEKTVWGGSGCQEDLNGNGVSDRAEVPTAAATGADVVVFSRGTCFFSIKVESGQLKGYKAVLVAQSHAGTRNGLLPDGFICGSQGHTFTPTVSAMCIGHRAAHLLFDDAPAYAPPESFAAGGDMPAIGTIGAGVAADTVFDGWGYVHLHDATRDGLPEIDQYMIPEAGDADFATGFGNLTVHEVQTDPRGQRLAYFSYYSGGLRVASFGPDGIDEIGHYIAEGGNDFWGIEPVCAGQCLLASRDRGRGRDNGKRPLLLLSDRDSGLWIFRYTGAE